MEEEVKLFTEPEELVHWLMGQGTSFAVSVEDAALLIQYMEGHDYALGVCGQSLIRKDMAEEQGEVQEYSICDAIDAVYEWNYELLCHAETQMQEAENQTEFDKAKAYCESLRRDEGILDALFDRSPYGKALDELAVGLAHTLLENLKQGKEMSESVGELVGAVRQQGMTDNRGR